MTETAGERTLPPATGFLGGALLAAGLVELAAVVFLGWARGGGFPLPGTGVWMLAFAAYAGAGWWAGRSPGAAPPSAPGSPTLGASGVSLAVVWGVALAMRLALIPVDPFLSDDIWRYLWDGHVQLQGVNPYLHAPGSAAVDSLATPWRDLINNPTVPTIYPPAAQGVFALIGVLGSTVVAAKSVWVLFDLATGWLLYRVAQRTGRRPLRVLVLYLWSPLVVVETAWSGHLDALGLFWVALLLLWLTRPVAAGLAGGLAALSKFAPAAAFPPIARRLGWRFAAAAGACLVIGYLPYASAGSALWTGLGTYAEHWRFNQGAFWILESLFPPGRPPRYAAAVLVMGVVGWATWQRWGPERALFWTLGTGLLLSPTVHPWYVVWLVPFAALRTNRAWLLLSGLVFLGYWGLAAYQETGAWPEPLWARLVVWLPFWALLLYDFVRGQGTPPMVPADHPARD